MPAVNVVHAPEVEPFTSPGGLDVQLTLGRPTDFGALQQAVLGCGPGMRATVSVPGDAEETLFVLEGEGRLHIGGTAHALSADTGVYLPPGSEAELENTGEGALRLVGVRVPDPSPGPPTPASVARLDDQATQQATTEREFRIVADPATGLRSATHFVGYIPTERAPDHFHTYDEVIYVLDGEGVMEAGAFSQPVRAGSCIQLPARTVHCLSNAGSEPMRIVAVFRPAGSPAAAFYPDGTPAYQSNQDHSRGGANRL
ncbi:MAG TPA: cupin domain-containing protein [Solirubrobacteraceae bacterium]|jgi:mannose-6-phosphate isomerase-like protein (cupin superfamily)|nr:cupin domain-containing protein [Solirubrobacteraceae bacterium]